MESGMTEEAKPKPRKKRTNGITQAGQLSKAWSNFFTKSRELPEKISQWKNYHLVGYMCNKFLETYNTPYSFLLKGAPSKCQEMFVIRSVMVTLNSDNPKIIKEYIDFTWEKLIKKKQKINNFSIFMSQNLLNEFNIYRQESQKIKRSTPLPKQYLDVASELDIDVATFGDLAFIKMALQNNSDGMENYNLLFNKLASICFDDKVLESLDD